MGEQTLVIDRAHHAFARSRGRSRAREWLGHEPRFMLDEDVGDLINACTFRCRFNLELGRLLETPYSPSIYRLPYRCAMYGNARKLQRHLATVEAIDDAYP